MMQTFIEKLAKAEPAPGDYVGPDGLLYCGTCHKPRQMFQAFSQKDGGEKRIAVRIACACQQRAEEEEQARFERARFRMRMQELRDDGISCPGGLHYRFEDDDRRQPKVSDACLRYVECWEEMKASNIGMLFYGSVGTGKSFLASCIGNGLLDRQVPVAATNFPRLLNLLQSSREKQAILDRLSVYKLLIVDDLGVERDSAYAEEQIFNIIDARCSSGLPVIVTTNLTLEELEHPPSMQYARIYDRVLEMCPVRMRLAGESRRKENAARRKALASELLLG